MAEETKQTKLKLRFTDEQKSPTLEIGNGDYVRKFDAKEQPFDCDLDEAAMLLRTGHFVEADATGDGRTQTASPAASTVSSPIKSADAGAKTDAAK